MNLNQMRFVRETVRHDFNLSAAAKALFTSQPGVSKAILELEQELGVDIFVRHGKRIKGLTQPGGVVLPIIERILKETESLRRVGEEFAAQGAGNLVIATTHTQARYTLPKIVQAFRLEFPRVHLSLLQGNPAELAAMVLRGDADLAVATEAIAEVEGLLTIPCFEWTHVVVVPVGHPLEAATAHQPLSLELLGRYPLVTYDRAFAGRARIDEAFKRRAISADIVLAAIDADVIKTYVESGLGVGIVAGIAFDAERDVGLRAIAAGHLFGPNVTRVAVLRGAYLRSYAYEFIALLAPGFGRDLLEQLIDGTGAAPDSYQL